MSSLVSLKLRRRLFLWHQSFVFLIWRVTMLWTNLLHHKSSDKFNVETSHAFKCIWIVGSIVDVTFVNIIRGLRVSSTSHERHQDENTPCRRTQDQVIHTSWQSWPVPTAIVLTSSALSSSGALKWACLFILFLFQSPRPSHPSLSQSPSFFFCVCGQNSFHLYHWDLRSFHGAWDGVWYWDSKSESAVNL